jgi:hypothetical protein
MSSPVHRTDAHQARRDALRASVPYLRGESDIFVDAYIAMRDRLDSAPAFAPIPGTLVEWREDSFKPAETSAEFSARMARIARGDQ